MNYFNKKTSVILISVCTAAMILSSLMVLFSNEFIGFAYNFLSKVVFHREFSIDKWIGSIRSFFLFPIFIVLFAETVLFVKFTDRAKLAVIGIFLADAVFVLLYTVYKSTVLHVNSDLGSELMLGQECVRQHSFWPKTWYYSTEIRLINTQFFSALGFLFSKNFDTVKTIQSFCTVVAFFFVCLYLLNQLEIKKLWIKLLCCTLIILPFSYNAYYVGAGDNYYVPHAAMSMALFATFIKYHFKKDLKRPAAVLTLFYVLSFLSGLSSMRYLTNFVLPLTIAAIAFEGKKCGIATPFADFKGFWLGNKVVRTSIISLFLGGFGYVCNNLVLQHFYTFSQWNSMNFCHIGDVPVRRIFADLLGMFGYQQGIAVMSPGGVLNIVVYAALILFLCYSFTSIKKGLCESNELLIVFFAASFILNTFLYFNVDYIGRYYYPIIVYVFPVLAVLLSNSTLDNVRRWCLGASWAFLITFSTFATCQMELGNDYTAEERKVAKWLVENNYHYGYGTFWNTTVFTYLTNGKLEVANLKKDNDKEGHTTLAKKYEYDKWLTPKRYYENTWAQDGNVFLIITNDQYNADSKHNLFTNGKLVYSNNKFQIYDFPNLTSFINGF